MAAKVIPLKKTERRVADIIDEVLEQHPPDQCPEVVDCLKSELEKIIEKYFINVVPELSLKLPSDLSQEQFDDIRASLGQLFDHYNEQMLERSGSIFRDLYQSKLELCRLKHRHENSER
ncbi:MAG: hypothetical protein R6V33_08535 [Pelovirga sp.]